MLFISNKRRFKIKLGCPGLNFIIEDFNQLINLTEKKIKKQLMLIYKCIYDIYHGIRI